MAFTFDDVEMSKTLEWRTLSHLAEGIDSEGLHRRGGSFADVRYHGDDLQVTADLARLVGRGTTRTALWLTGDEPRIELLEQPYDPESLIARKALMVATPDGIRIRPDVAGRFEPSLAFSHEMTALRALWVATGPQPK
jgi:hypothetical protein